MPPENPFKPIRKFLPRKLLVAALGVATINYVGVVACGGATTDGTSGDDKKNVPPTSGNLPSPPPTDASPPLPPIPPTSGNLPAPPPDDGGADADAGDAGDSGDAAGEDR